MELDQQRPEALMESTCRKEKRKAFKKMKRRQVRKEVAEKERLQEEARLNDPDEQMRIRLMQLEENERIERERTMFEERERAWVEAMELKKKKQMDEEEEEQRRRDLEAESMKQQVGNNTELIEDDGWDYVEEGPAEIIWQGNEIIVKKKRVRIQKKDVNSHGKKEDDAMPTSNPLPPQSEAFTDYKSASVLPLQKVIENVAQQVPNFGTEQDKAHCPFHLKTGACRFGQRCSRVHFYPDKACTLLVKNMYTGPGLAWEQDEGLEYMDEEVERCYEEFYEDVHTEFLKFGEIVNFKVCKNGSFHLRGNVYVHYKSLDSAELAYHSINGRFFAGKQIRCEYVNVTRWKVAICGEFMKSGFKTCSHGTACNFIHCFGNPGGDYGWADSDKPPPRYWIKKMVCLFGYSEDYGYEKQLEQEYGGQQRNSRKLLNDAESYHSRRSRSRDWDHLNDLGTGRSDHKRDVENRRNRHSLQTDQTPLVDSVDEEVYNYNSDSKDNAWRKGGKFDTDSDGEQLDRVGERNRNRHHGCKRKSPSPLNRDVYKRTLEVEYDKDWSVGDGDGEIHHNHTKGRSRHKRKSDHKGDCDFKSHQVSEDLSDIDGGRKIHSMRRHERKVGSTDDYTDRRNRAHETYSQWYESFDRHHSKKQKSSRHDAKTPNVINGCDTEDSSCVGEYGENCSEKYEGKPSNYDKKCSRWNEVIESSDGQRDLAIKSKDTYQSRDSFAGKSNLQRVPSGSDKGTRTYRSLDISNHSYGQHIDKDGRWEAENCVEVFED